MIRISIKKKLAMADGEEWLSIDTSVEKGQLVAIFGKSGVGKTSLLRIIAGLLQPDTGIIISDNETWLDTDRRVDLPVQKRKIGFVFQDLALFPNMTVRQNLQYAVKDKRSADTTNDLLKMVNLQGLADRKPDTLSGGQRQRVAIIRALAGRPDLLLLDEPFSSLDAEMRQNLREDLLRLHQTLNLTTLLVTHDLADIYSLSDKVIVIDKGSLVRSGKPSEVFGTEDTSGMVQLQGEIVNIKESGVFYVAEILTGHTIIKLLISEEERNTLRPGMKVLICSGSFEPVIKILG
jgi:molybdate transport system ATP-binding protein